jgi:SOS-response transcriptional repressor LexA
MTKRLTPRQAEMLRFIYDFGLENGYAPSLREIGFALGIVSTNGVGDHLLALERKGCLYRTRNVARSIVLTGEALRFLKPELALQVEHGLYR